MDEHLESEAPTEEVARRRSAMRTVRLVAVIAVLALAAVVAVVSVIGGGPPSEQELLKRAGLIGKSELLIGVKDDQPGSGLLDEKTGEFTGFDIDIALMVAAELGFGRDEVVLLPIESEDRARRQAKRGDGRFVTVDLVVATYSITKEREARPAVNFSSPYLETEQSVITRRGHPQIEELRDLAKQKVCSLSTATSENPVKLAGAELTSKKGIRECVDELLAGRVEAVTTDAAILAGFVAADPTHLTHHDIGWDPSEFYGINVGPNEALRELVDLALYRSRTDPGDKRWEDAFNTHLRPLQRDSVPQQVAVDEQPDGRKVEVREWPWERRAGTTAAGSSPVR